MASDHPEILKRNISRLFDRTSKYDDRTKLLQAVDAVHNIVTKSTILIKLLCLEAFERSPSTVFVIEDDLIDTCFKVMQGSTKLLTRNDADGDELRAIRSSKFDAAFNACNRLFGKQTTCALSLSMVLAESKTMLTTAYNNNINAHYTKYVRRYIMYHIQSRLGRTTPKGAPRETSNMTGNILNHLLYGFVLSGASSAFCQKHEISTEHWRLEACPPRGTKACLITQVDGNPLIYLNYMVKLNRMFEIGFPSFLTGRRLYKPLILSTSMIPSHIRIGTSALAHLFMTQPRIEEYKQHYFENYGIRLNMTTKGDMLMSHAVVTGIKDGAPREISQHATRLWTFIFGNLHNKKFKDILSHTRNDEDKTTWCFDNSIVTDGYSGSFQIVKATNLSGKNWAHKQAAKRAAKSLKIQSRSISKGRSEFPHLDDDEHMRDLCYGLNCKKCLGCDPGKGCLLCITDGKRTLKYTFAERDYDTHKSSRMAQQQELRSSSGKHALKRGWMVGERSLHAFETEVMTTTRRQSCVSTTFIDYVIQRNVGLSASTKLYHLPLFRQHKFLVHSKAKSSLHRFAQKVVKTFQTEPAPSLSRQPGHKNLSHAWMHRPGEDSVVSFINYHNYKVSSRVNGPTSDPLSCKDFIIFCGDWGRNPNLKHSAPTPGIGLRRHLAQLFHTITTPEHWTSKTCPCCRTRTMEKPDPFEGFIGPKRKHSQSEKHHLLRCTNVDTCPSRWWHRDSVGAFNILYNGVERLLELQ